MTNMIYHVTWLENKTTKTGKSYKSCQLKDEKDAVLSNVSIWSNFPDFANIAPGSKIDGEAVTNERGYISLKPSLLASNGSTSRSMGGFPGSMLGAKEKSIAKAQENKEEGIKTSSTIRMATDVAIALSVGRTLSREDTENLIKFWRKWFIDNWDLPKGEYPNDPPDLDNLK